MATAAHSDSEATPKGIDDVDGKVRSSIIENLRVVIILLNVFHFICSTLPESPIY